MFFFFFLPAHRRVHSAHYSAKGREDLTMFAYNKNAQQIRKNEELAKQLGIPGNLHNHMQV